MELPSNLKKKKMPVQTMLAKIEQVLKTGSPTDPPAYTFILGAGASYGVVPTAKEMLGVPDASGGNIHDRCIPVWLDKQSESTVNHSDNSARADCSKAFWSRFCNDNADNERCKAIELDSAGFLKPTAISAAYQVIFDTSCIGGLDTPERHRKYMREVTLATTSDSAQLNATHFYLASLLSLQKRVGQLGSDKKLLYSGRRELARTIFTTNFDPMLQTSLQLFRLLYYMTDRPEFLSADALQTDAHSATHLFYAHGSVHRPYMANTDEQIAQLKQQNARALAAYLGEHGVIVLGYSGWDDCLLEALNQTRTFSNNLYWLARGADSITESVAQFLGSHSNAYWVEIDDGGSFMADLHARLCPGAPNTEMLYNPIHPVMHQLRTVSLAGIKRGGPKQQIDNDKSVSASDVPQDVEAIREQVISRLQDAQNLFVELSKSGTDWRELERKANLSYANNDWDLALSTYSQLLTESERAKDLPVDRKALALFRRGYCYGQKNDWDPEFADYTAVIELPGAAVTEVAKARVNRGLCYGQKNEVEKEIADYTAVINLAGAPVEQIAQARVNRGYCYWQKGEFERAVADYSAAIELPGAPVEQVARARINRSAHYVEKDELDQAIEDYSAVIGLPGVPDEQIAQALVTRGFCYGQQDEVGKAIADYTAVIEMRAPPVQQIAQARVNRGFCYEQQNEVQKAIADYTAVIEMRGAPVDQLARALVNRGVHYGDLNQTEQSIADYTAVIALPQAPAEDIAHARINRGVQFGKLNEVDDAIADYTAVIELPGAPEEPLARALLYRGIRYQEKNELDKAITDYTAVIELPEAPQVLVEQATSLRAQCQNPS